MTGDVCLYQILENPLSGQGSIFDWGGRDLGASDMPTKTQHGHTNTSLGNLKKMEVNVVWMCICAQSVLLLF